MCKTENMAANAITACGFEILPKNNKGIKVYTSCPFCGDIKSHLCIYTKTNFWKCFRCGEHGKLEELVSKVANVNKTLARQIVMGENISNIEKKEIAENLATKISAVPVSSTIMVDAKKTNEVYKKLLAHFSLSERDKQNLLKRGLSEEEIKTLGYKSIPSRQGLDYFLAEKEGIGVPGIYRDKNKTLINNSVKGFLIPSKNIDGDIYGCQIRTYSDPKYLWLTSCSLPQDAPNGVGAYAGVHFSNFTKENIPENIYFTEGGLKADIAALVSNKPFMSIPGVNSTNGLYDALDTLKSGGAKRIILAMDMDKRTNENVKKALEKIKKIIQSKGIEWVEINWDKKYKGIDDFLIFKRQKSETTKK